MEIWIFIRDYWHVMVSVGGLGWVLVKMYFNQKEMRTKMQEMEKHMNEHDESDKQMADELTALIDRNKSATEIASREIQKQLGEITSTLAVVTNNLNLIISNRINTNQ